MLSHAAARPEEPWLFYGAGWDWLWRPWGALARWTARWAEHLAAWPAGTRVATSGEARPEAVVADLAVQAAGLVAVPEGPDGSAVSLASLSLPAWEDKPASSLPSPDRWTTAGGAVVRRSGTFAELEQADLIAVAQRIQQEIQPGKTREILVLGGPWDDPVERALLAWATWTGAAVLLEPDPGLRAATTAWARPTLAHGTPAQLARLRRAAGKDSGRRPWRRAPRLPFGRLRTVLVTGPDELPAEDAAFWSGRGVRLARMPEQE